MRRGAGTVRVQAAPLEGGGKKGGQDAATQGSGLRVCPSPTAPGTADISVTSSASGLGRAGHCIRPPFCCARSSTCYDNVRPRQQPRVTLTSN